MKNISALLVLFLIISSCEFGEKKKQVVETSEIESVTHYVDYQVEKIDQKFGPCAADSSAKQCILFQIEYPVITGKVNPSIIEKINSRIRADIFQKAVGRQVNSFEQMMTDLSGSYDSLIKDFDDYTQAWLVEINSDILYQQENYISVASTVFTYTGGAHPNNSQVYRSYDLKTGEAISLDDILEPGYASALNSSAEIEFRMQKEIPPNESLESAGYWLEDGIFKVNDNFAIINESLMFYYNPYEIGPYSLGATELELKLTDYVELIDPNGPIGELKN